MAPKKEVAKGRPVGVKGQPKALRVYIALQRAGYSFEDAEKIVAALTVEKII